MYVLSKSESKVGRGDGALERGMGGERRPEEVIIVIAIQLLFVDGLGAA